MSLFQNWHLVRVLQLAMGLLLTGSHLFYRPDGVTLAFGLILLLQAALNISCVGGACAAPRQQVRVPENAAADEVEYEEIKG